MTLPEANSKSASHYSSSIRISLLALLALIMFDIQLVHAIGCDELDRLNDHIQFQCSKIKFDGHPPFTIITSRIDRKISEPKNILIFMDGTGNGPLPTIKTTNVWRLFQAVAKNPESISLYIEGVGSDFLEDPKGLKKLNEFSEQAIAIGMRPRVVTAYQFLASNYKQGDKLYIFGFSRGAVEARTLAGLLAYAGLPSQDYSSSDVQGLIEKIMLEIRLNKVESKIKPSERLGSKWAKWKHGDRPIVGNNDLSVEIEFLGLWDTVYGVPKKELDEKTHENELLMGSYPTIRHIVQALSLDEKRSRFAPIRLEPPMSAYTEILEVGFPGAHADVGGGYGGPEDGCPEGSCTKLPSLSLNWMVAQVNKSGYKFIGKDTFREGDPAGVAHWSMGYNKASLMSSCNDRVVSGLLTDASKEARSNSKQLELQYVDSSCNPKSKHVSYPLSCGEVGIQYCRKNLK